MTETNLEFNSSTNKVIRSNDSGINISEEMGKTAIWKQLSGGTKSGHSKNKKRKKREHNAADRSGNKDMESGDQGNSDNSHVQPLLNDSRESGRDNKHHYMTTPEIVVNPPSARESPELKHQNPKV